MTTPPLDLTAIRRDVESAAKCQPGAEAHPWEYVDPDYLIELLDRLENAERDLAAVREVLESETCEHCTDAVLTALDSVPYA